MAIIYDAPSTDWETETETTSAPRILYPIAQNTSAIIYERDYVINEADWTPATMDTADVTYTSAFLVEETTPTQIGGTLVTYTKRFATVPSSWTDYDQRVFQFPGYHNDPDTVGYRAPLNKNATWYITLAYELTSDPYADFDVTQYIFQVKDSDGIVLSYVDASTTPTLSAYQLDVSGEALINTAHTTLERYAGNIWLQKLFRSKAQ